MAHRPQGSDLTYRFATVLGRVGLRALDIDVVVDGLEHVPASGPVLLAATHVSYPDFLFIQAAAEQQGRQVRFMCRHDVWKRPWSWPMDAMRHIPVDRTAPAGAYLTARSRLTDGEAVCAFPEAGISYSFTVRSLMRGVASLARETQVPVVPVALWGAQRLYTVGLPDERGRGPAPDWTRGRRVDVAFGEPLTIASGADLTAWTHLLGHRMTDLLEGLQRRPHHVPEPGEHAPWYPAHLGGHAPTRAEAAAHDDVPRSAVTPSWGPLPDAGEPPTSRAG